MAKAKIFQGSTLDMLIASGTAPFRFTPTDIGKIVYVSSSDFRAEPYTQQQKTMRLALYWGICAVLTIATFAWRGFADWLPYIVLVGAGIAAWMSWSGVNTFEGEDYFVGEAGFATASFKDSRDNIVTQHTVHYADISEIFHKEHDVYETHRDENRSERRYDHTDFCYEFYGNPDAEGNVEFRYRCKNKYVKKGDETNYLDYYFMRAVEEVWSRYRHNAIEATNPSSRIFSEVKRSPTTNGYFLVPHVALTSDAIIVNSTVFPHNQIKSIKLENGEIVITHANYSSSMLGLKHTGDKAKIDINTIGNAQLLCYYLRLQ